MTKNKIQSKHLFTITKEENIESIETPFGLIYLCERNEEENCHDCEKYCHPKETLYANKLLSPKKKNEFIISRCLIHRCYTTL